MFPRIQPTNPNTDNANLLMDFSEKDYRTDILERIRTSMDLPPTYDKLAWRLSTASKTDNFMRLQMADDLQTVFRAVRDAQKEQAKRKSRAKTVSVHIKNLVSISFIWARIYH